MRGCITAISRSPVPAASASTVHGQIPANPVYTYSDLSIYDTMNQNGGQISPIIEPYVTVTIVLQCWTSYFNNIKSQLFFHYKTEQSIVLPMKIENYILACVGPIDRILLISFPIPSNIFFVEQS